MPFFRQHISAIIARRGWEALLVDSGEAALTCAANERQQRRVIHVALVDILMPQARIEGIEAARQLIHEYRIPCIMLTSVNDVGARMACHLSGVAGYITKDATLSEEIITTAIEQSLRGKTMNPPIDNEAEVSTEFQRFVMLDNAFQNLTPAQRRVASMMQQGHTNAEIARHLGISVSTVNTHVQEVLARLGLSSRRDLLPCRLYDTLGDDL